MAIRDGVPRTDILLDFLTVPELCRSSVLLQCCFTSTETILRTIKDGEVVSRPQAFTISPRSYHRPPGHGTRARAANFFFFPGALRPQNPYGLFGTGMCCAH